ncbi:MAG TPA: Stk1 family PASTA domain-containing Ser/Thr kinase [Acidimicrobiia bacterium]|nr:Stk1 family PASTA domain-containing Ser/Thr kinase [Acidimicrobiia bacterium]
MSLVGQVFSNRYRIEREIAQGGMAEVYLARDQSLDRPVALKALFPEYAREPSFVERFRREAQAAANLNHPNIVAIYDWGQESGTYFIVMEYVQGRSLRDLIRSEGPLEAGQAADITAEIASALAFAHRSGVVHRDVKPGNVLLTQSGTVKVTDFGIARAGTSDGLTQTGSVMGTATYFSPEQAQGLAVDGRSDVYSVGVVLYELVCGVPPFAADSPVSVAYKHVREDPVPPSRRNPDVPQALEQIIMSALAKDPEHRYQSADDLRADLLRFRRGRPLAAAPVTGIVAEVPTTAVANAGMSAYAATATIASPRVPVDQTAMYAQQPARRRHPATFTILTLLVLAALVGGILYASMKLGGNQVKVPVPNVIGKTEGIAVQALAAQHLIPVTQNVTSSAKIGTVVAQQPTFNTQVKKGSNVTISVSVGLATKPVPQVSNASTPNASRQLQTAGFQVKVDLAQYSNTVDPGSVISTIPPNGTTAQVGSVVHIIPSKGVNIPNVLNLPQATAFVDLRGVGLNPVAVPTASTTVANGNVVSTNPASGAVNVKPASTIQVLVSTGAAQVQVPAVVGDTVTKAQLVLAQHQLQSNTLSVGTRLRSNDGKVLAQNPTAGAMANTQSIVVLSVGVFTPATTQPPNTTPTSGP